MLRGRRFFSQVFVSARAMSTEKLRVVAALDQGTSSTRCILFDHNSQIVTSHQIPLKNHYPHPGWVEHEPQSILTSALDCMDAVAQRLREKGHLDGVPVEIVGVGITNQRETTIVWDSQTGKPLYRAIVWSDTRTKDLCHQLEKKFGGQDAFRSVCGLPISTYFSALKLKWLIENVPAVKKAVEEKRAMFGTVDTWLLWNLTGGVNGGQHVTDVTNASRTMLMDLATANWSSEVAKKLDIPLSILPTIKSSSQVYGECQFGAMKGIPISGMIGDQQAALLGQLCVEQGSAKNTYGTGCFLLMNTGEKIVPSKKLLTTVGFQLGAKAPISYAVEGAMSGAGSSVQWLRDNLGIIQSASDIGKLAAQVPDNGGIYFVPAFSGLLCPHWRPDARAAVIGLTNYTNKNHFCRAILEAICYQTREVVEAMVQDASLKLSILRVDGGVAASDVMLQFQADQLGVEVVRGRSLEATGLGAAYAAGLGVGFWKSLPELRALIPPSSVTIFEPKMAPKTRNALFEGWKKAVVRTFDWVDPTEEESPKAKL